MRGEVIILNTVAKSERAGRWEEEVRRHLPGFEIVKTLSAGHGVSLAREAVNQGASLVVAAGGDGTVNEVVNGLGDSGVCLGILPIGSVNVLAMELGLPMDVPGAARVIREGATRKIDLGQVNGRRFVQLAGVGLDAQVVRETDHGSKKALGPLSYVLTAVQVAARPSPTLRVWVSGREEMRGSFVLIGNGRFYGGPFQFFPGASLEDGELDVCVFQRTGHLDLLRYLRGVVLNRLPHYVDVEMFRASQLRIESDEEVPAEVDGELCAVTPVEVRVLPRALSVRVPGGFK